MKAEELRVGNWISFDGRKSMMIKKGEEIDMVSSIEGQIYIPILLTPEILEKCGFKKETRGNYSSSWINLYPYFGIVNAQYWKVTTVYNCPPIIHLHQLQNLYFALTQTELEIKF